jgi:hypothetical protein
MKMTLYREWTDLESLRGQVAIGCVALRKAGYIDAADAADEALRSLRVRANYARLKYEASKK